MYTINYHHVLLSHYNILSLVNLPHNHLQRLYYGHAFLSQEILPYHVLSGIFVLRKMPRNQPRNKLWQVIYFIVPFFSLFGTGLLFLIMYWCAVFNIYCPSIMLHEAIFAVTATSGTVMLLKHIHRKIARGERKYWLIEQSGFEWHLLTKTWMISFFMKRLIVNDHGNFMSVVRITNLINILFLYQSAWPDVIIQDLTSDHEFIVLACDGKIIYY